MADKKYYWLKLDRNFFKRHDIQVIESQANGKEYVLFYLKLLVESIDHEGSLRFNEFVPYDDVMLSTITNTNIDIVRNALKVFASLEMIEVLDDQTIFVRHTQKMLGEGKSTDRVRRYRENRKTLLLANETDCNVTETLHETDCNVTETLHETEIEKEIDIEKEIKKKPTAKIQFDGFDFSEQLKAKMIEWFAYKKEKKDGYTDIGIKRLLDKVKARTAEYGEQTVINLIDDSMANNWKGIVWDKLEKKDQPKKREERLNRL